MLGEGDGALAPLADAARATAWLRERLARVLPDVSAASVNAAAEHLGAELAAAAREAAADGQLLRALLDAVPDHIGVLDPDGTWRYFNRATVEAVREASGGKAGDPVGKRQDELGLPDDFVRQIRADRLAAITESITSEILFPTAAGGRWREHTFAPIRDDRGALVGIAISSRDIHDRKQAQDELAGELAFREQMMGVLGHDLRGPVSVIMLAANQLSRQGDLGAGAAAAAARIGRAARRMNQMISHLLDVTQLRFRGSLPLSLAAMDLREACEEIIDELRSTHPDRTIRFEARGDTRGEWDRTRIGQVLSNLLGNAITHGDAAAPIEVRVTGEGAQGTGCVGQEVILEVHNQGPTIPADTMAGLFQPFRRGPSTEHAEGAGGGVGLGLGLYIVKETAVAHGGAVDVRSTPEAGTVFTVRLPRTPAQRPPGDAGAAAAP